MAYQQSYMSSSYPDTEIVLSMQCQHRSTAIWEGNIPYTMRIRHDYHKHEWTFDDCGRRVVLIGIPGVSRLGAMNIDHALVTNWQSDGVKRATHSTYQLARPSWHYKMLQPFSDYELTDLWLAWHPWLIGHFWRIIGLIPDARALERADLRLQWWWQYFSAGLASCVKDDDWRQHARDYILHFLGAFYMLINQGKILGFSYCCCYTILRKQGLSYGAVLCSRPYIPNYAMQFQHQ